MNNNGWIKLHRSLLDNPIAQKPNYAVVWLYLLLKCNHKNKHIIWNNKKVLIKAGSFIGSLRKIARHYKISISTVKYIIDYFVSEQMIEHKANGNFSLFIIKKWKQYQIVEHQTEHGQNTNKTRIKTNNNDKNEKNVKIYRDGQTFTFKDKTKGIMRFGEWVDINTHAKLGYQYVKEINGKN